MNTITTKGVVSLADLRLVEEEEGLRCGEVLVTSFYLGAELVKREVEIVA